MSTSTDPRLQPDTIATRSDAAPVAEARPHAGRWANRGVVPRQGLGTGWVVVADEAIARILTTTEASGTLDQVEALTDPAAHAKEGELHVNDAGRSHGRISRDGGQGGAGAGGIASITASAGDDNRHLEARAFARRVAGHLATALQQKRYDTLRIVAAPRFLGLLRQELDAAVRAVVVEELGKDLIHVADDEIAKRLLAAQPGT
jgi:protein required for attachment to host cells